MNLYIVSRTDEIGYDEFDSIVVAADNEEKALKITPYSNYEEGDITAWAYKEQLEIECIGIAKEGTKSGIIHTSFNAG